MSRPAPTETEGTTLLHTFQLISTDGDILETFETAEQRWATGDTVIAHGNRRYRVVSVIPFERMSEFVDEPAGGVLEVEPL
jgi:hypothetical protein